MDDRYPRIALLSGSVFNPITGGGIMLTNLFRGWPTDRIAVAYTEEMPGIKPDTSICTTYYILGPKEFPWARPFSFLERRRGKTPEGIDALRTSSTAKLSFSSTIGRCIFGVEMPRRVTLSPEFRAWIDDVRPEVLYTILGNLPYMRLVRMVSETYGIPYVIHMMDDWPATRYTTGLIDVVRQRTMHRELCDLVRGAAACLAIGDRMCAEYERRYGRTFEPFMNTLNVSEWIDRPRPVQPPDAPFRVVYAGALLPNSQLESIRDIADAIVALATSGKKIRFDIYTNAHALKAYASVIRRGDVVVPHLVPATLDIHDLFHSADLLVLPFNFDDKSVRYVRYSMPNKVPAYLLSGTPIFVYGPSTLAAVQYAQDGQWGYVVTSRGQTALVNGLQKLLGDADLRNRLVRRAREVGHARHDATVVRRAFHETLIAAAQSSV